MSNYTEQKLVLLTPDQLDHIKSSHLEYCKKHNEVISMGEYLRRMITLGIEVSQ